MRGHREVSSIRKPWLAALAVSAGALGAGLAGAEEAAAPAVDSGDNAWLLVCSALVLMMTAPGLALFYGGLVRQKNVLSTMMHSVFLMGLVSVLWAVYGYSIAFAPGNAFFGSPTHYFLLDGVGAEPSGYAATVPHQTFMLFQMMFAIITPALISGAYAERVKFSAMVLFTVLWSTFVYFPLAHMVWGTGGLFNWCDGAKVPALDFAGGTVVHISSGISALVFALVLGKRKGYMKEPMRPHNLVLSMVGAALLWVGWFGFNAGSALSAGSGASQAFATTHFASAAGALAWAGLEWLKLGKPSALGTISGLVAGLVCITPAAGFVTIPSALLIGLAAGSVCFVAVTKIKLALGYDDSLDAFGVHGVGGTLGALLTGLLASAAANPAIEKVKLADGQTISMVGGGAQFVNQLLSVALTLALAAAATFAILKVVNALVGLRVDEDAELAGLDLTQHGEEAYTQALSAGVGIGGGHGAPGAAALSASPKLAEGGAGD
ncbi:MAG: ammonium transporter [Planctomycetota bacterium]|nr:ammonium transporter [Planctomycetota bacterium]